MTTLLIIIFVACALIAIGHAKRHPQAAIIYFMVALVALIMYFLCSVRVTN